MLNEIFNPFIIAAAAGFGLALIFTLIEDHFIKDDDEEGF